MSFTDDAELREQRRANALLPRRPRKFFQTRNVTFADGRMGIVTQCLIQSGTPVFRESEGHAEDSGWYYPIEERFEAGRPVTAAERSSHAAFTKARAEMNA